MAHLHSSSASRSSWTLQEHLTNKLEKWASNGDDIKKEGWSAVKFILLKFKEKWEEGIREDPQVVLFLLPEKLPDTFRSVSTKAHLSDSFKTRPLCFHLTLHPSTQALLVFDVLDRFLKDEDSVKDKLDDHENGAEVLEIIGKILSFTCGLSGGLSAEVRARRRACASRLLQIYDPPCFRASIPFMQRLCQYSWEGKGEETGGVSAGGGADGDGEGTGGKGSPLSDESLFSVVTSNLPPLHKRTALFRGFQEVAEVAHTVFGHVVKKGGLKKYHGKKKKNKKKKKKQGLPEEKEGDGEEDPTTASAEKHEKEKHGEGGKQQKKGRKSGEGKKGKGEAADLDQDDSSSDSDKEEDREGESGESDGSPARQNSTEGAGQADPSASSSLQPLVRDTRGKGFQVTVVPFGSAISGSGLASSDLDVQVLLELPPQPPCSDSPPEPLFSDQPPPPPDPQPQEQRGVPRRIPSAKHACAILEPYLKRVGYSVQVVGKARIPVLKCHRTISMKLKTREEAEKEEEEKRKAEVQKEKEKYEAEKQAREAARRQAKRMSGRSHRGVKFGGNQEGKGGWEVSGSVDPWEKSPVGEKASTVSSGSGWGPWGPKKTPAQDGSGWGPSKSAAPSGSGWGANESADPKGSGWEPSKSAAPSGSGWGAKESADPKGSGWGPSKSAAPSGSGWGAKESAAPKGSGWEVSGPVVSGWDDVCGGAPAALKVDETTRGAGSEVPVRPRKKVQNRPLQKLNSPEKEEKKEAEGNGMTEGTVEKPEEATNVMSLKEARKRRALKEEEVKVHICLDICFVNPVSIHNTRLLFSYATWLPDPRPFPGTSLSLPSGERPVAPTKTLCPIPLVKALACLVKLWAKSREVCGQQKGHLSAYALNLMVVHYLQRCQLDAKNLKPGSLSSPRFLLPNFQERAAPFIPTKDEEEEGEWEDEDADERCLSVSPGHQHRPPANAAFSHPTWGLNERVRYEPRALDFFITRSTTIYANDIFRLNRNYNPLIPPPCDVQAPYPDPDPLTAWGLAGWGADLKGAEISREAGSKGRSVGPWGVERESEYRSALQDQFGDSPLASLLRGFFVYFAREFDREGSVVSVRTSPTNAHPSKTEVARRVSQFDIEREKRRAEKEREKQSREQENAKEENKGDKKEKAGGTSPSPSTAQRQNKMSKESSSDPTFGWGAPRVEEGNQAWVSDWGKTGGVDESPWGKPSAERAVGGWGKSAGEGGGGGWGGVSGGVSASAPGPDSAAGQTGGWGDVLGGEGKKKEGEEKGSGWGGLAVNVEDGWGDHDVTSSDRADSPTGKDGFIGMPPEEEQEEEGENPSTHTDPDEEDAPLSVGRLEGYSRKQGTLEQETMKKLAKQPGIWVEDPLEPDRVIHAREFEKLDEELERAASLLTGTPNRRFILCPLSAESPNTAKAPSCRSFEELCGLKEGACLGLGDQDGRKTKKKKRKTKQKKQKDAETANEPQPSDQPPKPDNAAPQEDHPNKPKLSLSLPPSLSTQEAPHLASSTRDIPPSSGTHEEHQAETKGTSTPKNDPHLPEALDASSKAAAQGEQQSRGVEGDGQEEAESPTASQKRQKRNRTKRNKKNRKANEENATASQPRQQNTEFAASFSSTASAAAAASTATPETPLQTMTAQIHTLNTAARRLEGGDDQKAAFAREALKLVSKLVEIIVQPEGGEGERNTTDGR
uniref:Uncharacterized protein n=1 Tax=Chromera velia CCMP2878 TaxID=1169474 RepID=A0A0G4HMF5_9ALVE|eukprot:Cvel_7477.t1-p1 / transcript=Cvel_7477.t1 / gene=Cvel_7477 / organism=Chromera_velia_CCMP2878 / gene_product=hypothetical protein / transcript_product=hypothetical protein / location=Cvel_scaffold391:80242-86280(+) / protein_length=1684 / sequence_SO=supercontig / SO=protein_coding / is_pseudo=false